MFGLGVSETEELWRWAARFVNLLCSTKAARIGPCLLLEFLRVGGHAAAKAFGRQFVKLMDVVQSAVMPRFEALKQKTPEGIVAPITQLAVLLREYYANGNTFREPDGLHMKQRETELSQDV